MAVNVSVSAGERAASVQQSRWNNEVGPLQHTHDFSQVTKIVQPHITETFGVGADEQLIITELPEGVTQLDNRALAVPTAEQDENTAA